MGEKLGEGGKLCVCVVTLLLQSCVVCVRVCAQCVCVYVCACARLFVCVPPPAARSQHRVPRSEGKLREEGQQWLSIGRMR